jgi:hypothetical protein
VLAENSPQWYLQMQGVALDQQWDRAAFDALAERALAHELGYLGYHYFAVAESNYLLPKWYGKPGDTERYAAEVADRIGGDEGDAATAQQMFARIGNDWSESVWKTKAAFDAGRAGRAAEDASQASGDVVTIPSDAGAPPRE